jgi:outer membrane protein TolC
MRQRAVMLLLLWAAPVFAAWAQEAPAPLEAAETVEAPLLLTLKDCTEAALRNNLNIAVQQIVPRRREALLTLQEAVFDPVITGRALNSDVEAQQLNEFGLPRSFDTKTHEYRVGLEDPLPTGGRYRLELLGRDISLDVVTLLPGGFTAPINTTETDTTVTLTFIQPLLRNFGSEVSQWRVVVARNDLSVSESAFRQSLIEAVADTERAYWELNYTLLDLLTVQESLDRAQEFLEQNRAKVNAGTLAQVEITQGEAQVAQREQDLIVAEVAVQDAEDELRRVMGVTRQSPLWARALRPSDPPPREEVTPDVEEALAQAAASRPDLEQARFRIKSSEVEVGYWENQRRWGLDFEGSLGYQGVDFDEFITDLSGNIVGIGERSSYQDAFDVLGDGELPAWRMSLLLTVPLGSRSATASYTDSMNALEQARRELARLEQLAQIQTRGAVRRVVANLRRIKAAEVERDLQRAKLEAEEIRFENHISTSFEVLTYQTDLARAQIRMNRALVDYNKSLVDLERMKGTLLQSRGILVAGSRDDRAASAGAQAAAAPRSRWQPATLDMDGLFFGDARDYQLGPPPEPIFGGRRSLSSGLEEGGYLPRLGGTAKAP